MFPTRETTEEKFHKSLPPKTREVLARRPAGDPTVEKLQRMLPTRTVTIVDRRTDLLPFLNTITADKILNCIAEAEAADPRLLFAVFRDVMGSDSHLQSEHALRKIAVLGDTFSLLPADKKIPDDVEAKQVCDDLISNLGLAPDGMPISSDNMWIEGLSALMDGYLWPLEVIEKVYAPSSRKGLQFDLLKLVPVPDRLYEFTLGTLRLRDTDPKTGLENGQFSPADPRRYIVHKGHVLQTPPWWGGPFRALLFWWLLANQDREWWARFLDRLGPGFLLGKYNQSDDAGRITLQQAFGAAQRLGGLVVSKETEVEIVQAAAAQTGEAFEKFARFCQEQITKFITGQTRAVQPHGMNAGAQKMAQGIRDDLREFDKIKLGWTLRTQLFQPYLIANGYKGRPPIPAWGGVSSDEMAALGTALKDTAQAGLEPDDESLASLSEKFGFSLRRKAMPVTPPPFGQKPFPLAAAAQISDRDSMLMQSEAALDSIARRGAADLSRAFRGAYAPVRQIVLTSVSRDECERRLMTLYADLPNGPRAALLHDALAAFAGDGAVVNAHSQPAAMQ